MPMLIVNMGGEMVYILEQRLHAQNVPLDKSKRGAQLPMRTRAPATRVARAHFYTHARARAVARLLSPLLRALIPSPHRRPPTSTLAADPPPLPPFTPPPLPPLP